jgi:hypothetical protein
VANTPGNDQPRPPAPPCRPQAAPVPDDPGGCLTTAEIAELNRLDWEDPSDENDPRYFDDPDTSAPEWWQALPAAEQARQIEESLSPALVAESIAAGFTHRYGGNGSGFAAGGPLDLMLPGPVLAGHVSRVAQSGLAYLSDDALIGYLEANQELESWASGNKYTALLELDHRRAGPDGREGEYVAAEVGAALTLTPRSAQMLLERARELGRLGPALVLLRNGIIDPAKASVLARKLSLVSDRIAALVLDKVLRRAAQLTTGELGAACERAILAADPQAAIRRREKAQKDARVEVWTEESGTAAIAGRDLPPAEVIAADQQLTADAKWLKAHGAQGTQDQLRAKACTARLNGQPLSSLLPPAASHPGPNTATTGSATGTTGSSSTGRGAAGSPSASTSQPGAVSGSVNLTIPASAWLDLTDNPGEAASYGPIDAGTCRDLAQRLAATGSATQWCLTLVDKQGRAVGHGCAKTGPASGSVSPGTGPPGTGPPGTGPPGSAPPANGPPSSAQPTAGNRIAWLASIPIATIAAGSCDHQRESAGYRPPDSLRHLIKIRSPRCGEPGCRTPAHRADDDHTIPYHLGGKTCECNIHPMCRRSHRTKQAAGWHVTQPEPGVLVWTLPSGRTYTKITEPLPV